MVERELLIDHRKIKYQLKRKKVKNINFRIKEDKIIHISANKNVSIKYIEKILKDKKTWIFKNLDRLKAFEQEKVEYEIGDEILYLGEKYKLMLKKESNNSVYIKNNLLIMESRNIKKIEYKEKVLEEWYREKAKKHFHQLMIKVYNDFDLTQGVPKVRVIKMKKRYGTCYYRRNQINLNLKLIKADQASIEFVIAHELSHLKYHNHSKQFHDYLTEHMQDWKIRENNLKKLKILNYYNL